MSGILNGAQPRAVPLPSPPHAHRESRSSFEVLNRDPDSRSSIKKSRRGSRHDGFSAPSRSRTYNLQIKSLLLCQLSYGCGYNRKTTERKQKDNRETTEDLPPLREARQEGVEPPTHSLEGCCSIHLSYWRFTASCSLPPPSYTCQSTPSGRPDSNRRPPAPKAGAIPGYATPR